MKDNVRKICGAVIMAFVLLLPTGGAEALTISPPTFDFSLNPGDVVLDVIKIFNEGTEAITFFPILQNFRAGEEEAGQPVFYPADQDPDGTALAPWIKVDPNPITIGPNERANLAFSIDVPREGAQPGGHYGAILLSTQPPDPDAGRVSIGQQLGVLVLVKVAGELKEIGSIAEFGFEDPKVWYNHLPVDLFVRFENGGNTHLRPTGNLFIRNWWGRQVASLKVNEEFKSVLPKSIRRFSFGWQHTENGTDWSALKKEWRNFALGKYTAMLVLTYGGGNQIVTAEREFVVWPWRLMIIFGLSALAVILLFALMMRMYNRMVIRQYELHKKKEGEPAEKK
jgi:hypothetical protein